MKNQHKYKVKNGIAQQAQKRYVVKSHVYTTKKQFYLVCGYFD
jgi:hypothetical protein